jgi:Na+-driven multidrug efflux pump
MGLGLAKKHYSVTSVKDVAMLDKGFVKKFMSISLPAGLNEALWGIGVMICAAVFARQGSENYAAYTIFDSISSITFIFFQGLAAASAVLVGKTVGAGYLKSAYNMAKKCMIATPIMALGAGLLLILIRKPMLMLFSINGGAKEEIVSALIIIHGLWLGVRMINYTGVCGIFRAGGDSKFGVFLDLIGLYCCAIPAVLIAAYIIKVPFVILVTTMLVFDDGSKVFITLHHFRSRKWIKKLTQSGYVEEDEEC